MTKEDFFELLEDISPEKIQDAQKAMEGRRPAPVWAKWDGLAACLVLVAALAASAVLNGGISQTKDPLRPIITCQFNEALYEVLDMDLDAKVLDAYHLPRRITEDMVGDFLGVETEPGIAAPGNARPFSFYRYLPYAEVHSVGSNGAPRPQQAVYIVDTGEGYAFALFCRYIRWELDTLEEVDELFAAYGIDEAGDIAAITVDRRVRFATFTISDPEIIQRFYDAIRGGRVMGNDGFQQEVLGGLGELEQQEVYRELADSAVHFRLTTRDGLVTGRLTWRPTVRFIEWANNYYQLTEING